MYRKAVVLIVAFAAMMFGLTGSASAAPTLSTNGKVLSLVTYYSNGSDYAVVCGNFTKVNNVAASGIAVVNLGSGVVKFKGNLTGGWVDSCSIANNTVYAGGTFTKAGSVARNKVAAFSLSDFSLRAWKPYVGGYRVYSIAADSNKVYIASSVALKAVNVTSGAEIWSKAVSGGAPRSLMVYAPHNRLYVGGGFSAINGVYQPMLAGLSLIDGNVDTTFKPYLRPNTNSGAWPGFDGENVLSLGIDTTTNRICAGIAGHATNALACFNAYLGPRQFMKSTVGDVQAVLILPGRPGLSVAVYYAGYHRSYRGAVPGNAEWISNAWGSNGEETNWGDGFSGPNDLNQAGPYGNDKRNGDIIAMAVIPSSSKVLLGGAFTVGQNGQVAKSLAIVDR